MARARFEAAVAAAPIILLAAVATPVRAEEFRIAAGRLDDVMIALGEQSGRTIIIEDRGLARQRSQGVRGRMSLRRAVDQALAGIGAQARYRAGGVIRIERRAVAPTPRPPIPHIVAAAPPPEIVVTASKQAMRLDRFPGSVKLVDIQEDWAAGNAADGTAAITRLMPALGSTNLGNGRNKLFIRGIADSGFAGPTQAVTGQYLGDVRLTYNAPDPDLNLYDMRTVEVLVGPQGTLYGAGSLGGVIRLVPNPPDLADYAGSVAANTGTTDHGGISADGALMLNLPLVRDKVAVRLVAFGGRSAGYIDAPLQGRRNINAMASYGQRLSVKIADVAGWTIDLGSVAQSIRSDDGQYVLRGEPGLTRSTLLPEPFSNDYRVVYLSAARPVGEKKLLSVTSLTRHLLSTTFDASGFDGNPAPARYQEQRDITLLSHETRLSGGAATSWVAGLAVAANLDRMGVALDRSPLVPGAVGTRNHQVEGAVFGQFSYPLSSTLMATLGGRLTVSRTAFELTGSVAGGNRFDRWQARFSGTLGLNWRLDDGVSAFYRFQQGHRPGGLGLGLSGSTVVARRFSADELRIHEIGFRRSRGPEGLSLEAALFFADWRNMQADQIETFVSPSITNIGHGRIGGLDLELSWKLSRSFELTAAGFFNNSSLRSSPALSGNVRTAYLPNVARNGGRFGMNWRIPICDGVVLHAQGAGRYIGRSSLGIDEQFEIAQGNYVVADAQLLLKMPRWTVSLAIDNIANTRGNTFSYGNPFRLAQQNQETPVRPRTLTLGLNTRF